MNGLISDRFLKRYLKGFRRPTNPGFAPWAEALEKAAELTHELHHAGGVKSTPTSNPAASSSSQTKKMKGS